MRQLSEGFVRFSGDGTRLYFMDDTGTAPMTLRSCALDGSSPRVEVPNIPQSIWHAAMLDDTLLAIGTDDTTSFYAVDRGGARVASFHLPSTGDSSGFAWTR